MCVCTGWFWQSPKFAFRVNGIAALQSFLDAVCTYVCTWDRMLLVYLMRAVLRLVRFFLDAGYLRLYLHAYLERVFVEYLFCTRIRVEKFCLKFKPGFGNMGRKLIVSIFKFNVGNPLRWINSRIFIQFLAFVLNVLGNLLSYAFRRLCGENYIMLQLFDAVFQFLFQMGYTRSCFFCFSCCVM